MNKQELIDQVSVVSGLNKAQSKLAIDSVTAVIEASLAEGEPVVLVGFGSFEVTERPARIGRNPSTGVAMDIPASKGIKFRAGTALKKAVRP